VRILTFPVMLVFVFKSRMCYIMHVHRYDPYFPY